MRSLWERLDAVFYRSPVAISLCELDFDRGGLQILDCNEEACVLHGGSRDEVLAAGIRMPAQTKEEADRVRAWFKTPRPVELWRGETALKRLNGTELPIAYVWTRVEIGDRELVLAVERDITDQRQAQSALKESEQRFRQLIETADCLLWKARLNEVDGQLVWKFDIPLSGLRQRLFAAANLDHEEGVLWRGFNLPELATMDERCKTALKSGERNYRQEFRLLLPRETIWLQERVEIEQLGPREWNLVGVIVDITRLKETEAAMRTSEERNRLVLKASNDGIWDFSVVARTMATSERCRSMLGLRQEDTPESIEGWRSRIHPDDLDHEAAAWKRYRGTGEPCVYQARFRHEDGSWRWFMVRAISVTSETGELVRVIGSHTDITELKRNDLELQQGRRLSALGELVGGIAHEFNNLLTPMLLQTTMMTDDAASTTVRQQLKPVIDAIKDARDLTQRILTFGRRATGDAEALDLSAVVNDHLELLRHTIDRRVTLNVVQPATPLWVSQNRTDIAQIIINLVLNARDTLLEKASGPAIEGWTPTLTIRFATVGATSNRSGTSSGLIAEKPEPSTWHRVTVRDNGMGMTEQVKERIFEPFYTTKETGQGTGLGLATVWHLVKTMGGRIDVETRLGVGTAFHLSLPSALAPIEPTAAAVARPVIALRNKFARILVIDDQPEVADSLCSILQRWGHSVSILRDGNAAMKKLLSAENEFDVCITDLNMPGASGFEVIRHIRDRGIAIRVVVMAGYVTGEVRQTLQQLKVDAIVPKPFSVADIESAMRDSGW
ncbi:MAG: PAS domain S-box protein [Opitutus sp.]